jgi:hypothetical protein
VRASLAEVDGGLQQRLAGLVQGAAARVLQDEALESRIEQRLQSAVRYAVENYGNTVVRLISRTVAAGRPRRLCPDRGGRRSGPAVHPHQRHGGRGARGLLIHAVAVLLG